MRCMLAAAPRRQHSRRRRHSLPPHLVPGHGAAGQALERLEHRAAGDGESEHATLGHSLGRRRLDRVAQEGCHRRLVGPHLNHHIASCAGGLLEAPRCCRHRPCCPHAEGCQGPATEGWRDAMAAQAAGRGGSGPRLLALLPACSSWGRRQGWGCRAGKHLQGNREGTGARGSGRGGGGGAAAPGLSCAGPIVSADEIFIQRIASVAIARRLHAPGCTGETARGA